MRKHAIFVLGTLLLAWTVSAQGDRWYVVKVMGERAGWARMSEQSADGELVSESEMILNLSRGPTSIEVRMVTSFSETPEGRPVRATSTQSLGGAETIVSTVFDGRSSATVTSNSGNGAPVSREVDLGDTPWLPPAASRRALAKAIADGATTHVARTLEPTAGSAPISLEYRGFEQTTAESWGAVVPAVRVSVVSSMMPNAPSIEFLTTEGRLIRSATRLGGIEIEMILADRELAIADVDPPEIMRATFIEPDRPIDAPRTVRSGHYRLSLSGADLADVPGAASQSWSRRDASTIDVRVEVGRQSPATNVEMEAATGPTPMLDAHDEVIVQLLDRARPRDLKSEADRAEALRRFVYRHIRNKSLGVGFASASDVARSQTGDCTEHAVLLAAMLRADGIPARVVSGLVYADSFVGSRDIFGYHMWTQAAISDQDGPVWIDLDATLSHSRPFDATHIALSTSTLQADEATNAMLSLAPLLGALKVEVLATSTEQP